MLSVLEVTLPVFALVFCGFFGQRGGLLPAQAVQGLNAFVFYFALPAMLFRVVATQPVTTLTDWRFALGYALATLGVFLFTRAASLPPRKGSSAAPQARALERSRATAFGLNTAHGNVGYLGVPLVGELGRDLVPSMILAMMSDIFLVITLAIALLELERRRHGGPDAPLRSVPVTILSGLVRSPLVMSIAVGLAWSLAEPPMPGALDNFIRLMGAAAGPCALFAIGASLGDRRISIEPAVTGLMVLKLLVHPALAALLLYGVFEVDHRAAAVGVLAASLPAASNTFIIAQRYQVPAHEISSAILAGTFVSLISVSTVIWLLGLRA
jgi:malonate transporter